MPPPSEIGAPGRPMAELFETSQPETDIVPKLAIAPPVSAELPYSPERPTRVLPPSVQPLIDSVPKLRMAPPYPSLGSPKLPFPRRVPPPPVIVNPLRATVVPAPSTSRIREPRWLSNKLSTHVWLSMVTLELPLMVTLLEITS